MPDNRRPVGVVQKIKPRLAVRVATLDNDQEIRVPRYAALSVGDQVWRDGRGLYVPVANGTSRLLPAYRRSCSLLLGARNYAVSVREVSNDEDFDAYHQLAHLHYRGNRGFGRRSVLVLAARDPGLPRVLGYVEITTGFLMSKPRTRVLDARFADSGLTWNGWGAQEMKALTGLIARLSRLVVHPDLRGQGIGTMLVEHAGAYARAHFHSGGVRPLFLELTADMTKFVPFAERAGMRYVGLTEGNLHRVARDMKYLLKRTQSPQTPSAALKARGIIQAQRSYAARAAQLAALHGTEALAAELSSLNGTVSDGTYQRLHGILRLPRPTYLKGLTSKANQFLDTRIAELEVLSPEEYTPSHIEVLRESIRIVSLTVSYESSVPRTPRVTEVQEAFGIRPESFESVVLDGLTMTIEPGSTTLIYGPSGSGKTTLLNLFARDRDGPEPRTRGSFLVPQAARVGRFQDLPDDLPLVEALAPGGNTERALYALNMAGLSDAKLYLRRYGELSNGQKYRAQLASLIDSDANVWVADEFLSNLDPITASTVAANVARHVRSRDITLIVGAPHIDAFADVLKPDLVVRILSPWEHYVLDGRAFHTERLHQSAR